MEKQLIDACYALDVTEIKNLLNNGANPNDIYHFYCDKLTPLEIIVSIGEKYTMEILKLLVDYGADPNVSYNKKPITALNRAIRNSTVQVMKYLIENGAKIYPNILFGVGEISFSKIEVLLEELKDGEDVFQGFFYSLSFELFEKCIEKYPKFLEYKDSSGKTILSYVCQINYGDTNILNLHKYDCPNFGQSSKNCFCRYDTDNKKIQYILNLNAVDQADHEGYTAFTRLCENGKSAKLKFFIRKFTGDDDIYSNDNYLLSLAKKGCLGQIKEFLNFYPKIGKKDYLDALENGTPEVRDFLRMWSDVTYEKLGFHRC